jgi:hypothetical protein
MVVVARYAGFHGGSDEVPVGQAEGILKGVHVGCELVEWEVGCLVTQDVTGVAIGAGVVAAVVLGSKGKEFDSDVEGQEEFLQVGWDVDGNVEHCGRKETCLARQEVYFPGERGGVLLGLSLFSGNDLGLEISSEEAVLDQVPIVEAAVGGKVGVGYFFKLERCLIESIFRRSSRFFEPQQGLSFSWRGH